MSSKAIIPSSLADAQRRRWRALELAASARGLALVAWAGAALVLFETYDLLSWTAPVTADSANAVLQGRAMVQGNLLLHGWTLSGASFLMTDLPFNALAVAVRGLSPAAAHDVGAGVYTLLVLVACLLARGQARGRTALGRMAVTLVLLSAPAPGPAVQLLLLGPFHVGTTLVLLLALLALDAAARRAAWLLVFSMLLTAALLSDALALYVGLAPVALVALLRLLDGRLRTRLDWSVLAAALVALPLVTVVGWMLQRLGGFAIVPRNGSFGRIGDIPNHVALTVKGTLMMLGANPFAHPLSIGSFAAALHLLGVAVVLVACGWGLRAWRGGREREVDRVTQVLLVAMALDLAAYLFSNQATGLMTSRYLVPFPVFGAVVAGSVVADRLWQVRLRPATVVVSFAYLAFLLVSLRTPPVSYPDPAVTGFLEQHGLRYGLAAYWQASTVTLDSGGRVQVRAVDLEAAVPSPYRWEADQAWYEPTRPGTDARFVLRDLNDPRSLDRGSIDAAFGPPIEDYRVGHYEVMVWDRNLLTTLAR